MEKFKLVNYTNAIQDIARENKCAATVALQLFIANLATMREYYKGASHLNYATLGQQWNGLLSEERTQQKAEALAVLNRAGRGGRAE